MFATQTRVKQVATRFVHVVDALRLHDGDYIGDLLAESAVSCPHAWRQFALPVFLAESSCIGEVQKEAITKYASKLLPKDECCELIPNPPAPKSASHPLSGLYTLRRLNYTAATGLLIAIPTCLERGL